MKNQVLSIEQMKHLQELGLDISNASMFYVPKIEPKGEYCLLNVKPNSAIPFISTFTLQDILELLPKEFYEDGCRYTITLWYSYNRWGISYINDSTDTSFKHTWHYEQSLIEAAYEILCWCIENGYLNK